MAMVERIVSSICFRNIKYIATIHGIKDEVIHRSPKAHIESMLYKIFNLNLSAICYISKGVYYALTDNVQHATRSEIIYNPFISSISDTLYTKPSYFSKSNAFAIK